MGKNGGKGSTLNFQPIKIISLISLTIHQIFMSRGLITTLVIVGILSSSFLLADSLCRGTGVYDSAVVSQEEVNKTFADVQAAYQRRGDLF